MASVEPRSNPPFVALYKFRSSWTNSLSRTAKRSISLPMHPSAFFNPISLWTPLKLLWQVPFGKGEIDFHIGFTHHFANVSDRFGLWRVHQLSQQGHRIAGIAWYKLLRKRRRQTNPVPLIGGSMLSSDFLRWVFQNVDVPPNCLLFEELCACVVSCSYVII